MDDRIDNDLWDEDNLQGGGRDSDDDEEEEEDDDELSRYSPRQLAKLIVENGDVVYTYMWDSGGPGIGGGVDEVFCWKDKYAVRSSESYHPYGPYDSLEEAISAHNLTDVYSAMTEIDCSGMDPRELAEQILFQDDLTEVYINGERWYLTEDGEIRCESDDFEEELEEGEKEADEDEEDEGSDASQ